jgi:hypothetical protein
MMYFLVGVLVGAGITAILGLFWAWTADVNSYSKGLIDGLWDAEAKAAGFDSVSEYLDSQMAE